MNSIWFVSVIASMVMAVIITSIGTAPFLYLMAIAYGQQANTNGNSPVVGSYCTKKATPRTFDTWLSVRCIYMEQLARFA